MTHRGCCYFTVKQEVEKHFFFFFINYCFWLKMAAGGESPVKRRDGSGFLEDSSLYGLSSLHDWTYRMLNPNLYGLSSLHDWTYRMLNPNLYGLSSLHDWTYRMLNPNLYGLSSLDDWT